MDCFHFQHTANNQPSPAKTYPELGSTVMKYLRKEVGEMDIFPKKPLFEQDLEHIVDSTGIGTPAALQCEQLTNKQMQN